MKNTILGMVLGLGIAGVAVVTPSIAGQSAAVQENMHKQQCGRAKKALDDALVAIQASGPWKSANKPAAQKGVETAITEVQEEMKHLH